MAALTTYTNNIYLLVYCLLLRPVVSSVLLLNDDRGTESTQASGAGRPGLVVPAPSLPAHSLSEGGYVFQLTGQTETTPGLQRGVTRAFPAEHALPGREDLEPVSSPTSLMQCLHSVRSGCPPHIPWM